MYDSVYMTFRKRQDDRGRGQIVGCQRLGGVGRISTREFGGDETAVYQVFVVVDTLILASFRTQN